MAIRNLSTYVVTEVSHFFDVFASEAIAKYSVMIKFYSLEKYQNILAIAFEDFGDESINFGLSHVARHLPRLRYKSPT